MSKVELDTSYVGGVDIVRLGLSDTAKAMIDLAIEQRTRDRSLCFTSVNGEVLARRWVDHKFATLVDSADVISADGQPLVTASRILSNKPLPERVATTDLYPIVAELAQARGVSFYLFGASEPANKGAYDATRRAFPALNILGRSHGYLDEAALEAKLDEIDALKPDILWVAMGVPLEQRFMHKYWERLRNVGIIKTSGGLFDFVSGAKKRAPQWMQRAGLEWSFRLWLEPGRLSARYLLTNPLAAFILLTQTR